MEQVTVHFVEAQREEQLDYSVVALELRDFEQAVENLFEPVVPVLMEFVNLAFELYTVDLLEVAELLDYFVELESVELMDCYSAEVLYFEEVGVRYFEMSAVEMSEFEDLDQIGAFAAAESFVALEEHYNWADFHSSAASVLLVAIYEEAKKMDIGNALLMNHHIFLWTFKMISYRQELRHVL